MGSGAPTRRATHMAARMATRRHETEGLRSAHVDPAVQILSVEVTPATVISEVAIVAPVAGPSAAHSVAFSGWAAGPGPALSSVEFRSEGVIVGIAGTSPRAADDAESDLNDWRCDFAGFLPVFKLPTSFEVDCVAVFADGGRAALARLTGRWTPPTSVPEDALRPLMVTSLGRTGSTWLTRLLGQHPQISAYEPFRCEPRSASYWMEMYGAMSSPKSYHQILHGELYGPEWWVGTHRSPPAPKRKNPIEDWLAAQHVQSLLPFALERIDEFAKATAELEGKAGSATHFCEKFGLGSFAPPLLASLVRGAREILLVRDPRDMICSMLAYNRKRSFEGFGRDQVGSDVEFVHWWRGGVAQALAEWQARSDAAFRLKYEDLIVAPHETLERIFAHVGVEHDASTVAAVLERGQDGQQAAQKLHRTASDPAASIGRWREEFTREMAAAADDSLADLAEAFGYPR